jgi:hypothetical protein
MKKRSLTTLAVALASSGCFNHGTLPDSFPPAQGPAGARVALRVRGESTDRVGELIAVDSAGIAIQERRLIRVAWSRVDALDVAQLGKDYDIRFGEIVTVEKRNRLALVSRFPQGLAHLPITIDSLIADAARETQRFADRRVAVAAGYRRVGADFPGMGEHWLNVQALLKGTVDPARPTLLIYADINGQPRLLGAGFAVITHGDSTPSELPGWPERWHEHSGLLDEESGARTTHAHEAGDTHFWVMHAWTVLENPHGPFAADNWALPYLRAGRTAPARVDPAASRALALTVGGDEFVRGLLADAELRTSDNAAAIDSAIAVARSRALVSDDDHALSVAWRSLCDNLARLVGPRVVALLEPSHPSHE